MEYVKFKRDFEDIRFKKGKSFDDYFYFYILDKKDFPLGKFQLYNNYNEFDFIQDVYEELEEDILERKLTDSEKDEVMEKVMEELKGE